MKTKTQSKEKKNNQGKTMPDDFWNCLVNPIVGYHVPTIFSARSVGTYKQRQKYVKVKKEEE